MQPQDTQLLVWLEERIEFVVCLIFKVWVSYFEAPGKLQSNCRKEFANDVLREMNKKIRYRLVQSPISNGVVERNNEVLHEPLMKTMEDAKCDKETN